MIDDEVEVLRATSSLLRSCGFDVATFSSAEDFLHSTSNGRSACLISDVQMPGMTGVELFVALRERHDPVPVIFITAFAEGPVRQQIEAPVCVLQKPYQAEALIACIEKAISIQSET
ncbi:MULTISPECIES: response regulator transcription factor [unclassified Rhizobium]|uniref:response regulator transcription factor n=1 Tax=unclassified Rhizobium TaxID=2613769 RepID=UPI0021E7263B|nr:MULTISPECIES: response regulator [unclassified Rhizobium]MCV3765846.1 response regulator [Rhizobium sp. TRM95796]